MIRLTCYLLVGIGGTMFMADHFPESERETETVRVEQSESEIAPLFDASKIADQSEIILTSAPVEPTLEPTPVETVAGETTVADGYVPFSQPILIGADGNPVEELIEVETASNEVALDTEAEQIVVQYVSARRVNVRMGPSTNHEVVGGVIFAEAVQILSKPQDGWVQIRIEGDGVEGFMAARFLQENDPQG